jgi:hypothetical protein
MPKNDEGITTLADKIGGFTNELKNSTFVFILLLIIWKIPPYPIFAAQLFFPFKVLALLGGVTVSWVNVVHKSDNKRKFRNIVLERPIFFVTMFLLITAAYYLLYYNINDLLNYYNIKNESIGMWVLLVWFTIINVLFSMMLAMPIIYFRRDLITLFRSGRNDDDGGNDAKERDGSNNSGD